MGTTLIASTTTLAAIGTVAAVVALPTAGTSPPPRAAVVGAGVQKISFLPMVITEPGRYVVTDHLVGAVGQDGISVLANDVILQLRGHTLTGGPGSGRGIYCEGDDLVVLGGTLSGWGGAGIESAGERGVFRDLRLVANGGAGLVAGARSLVSRCDADGNGAGFELGDESTVASSAAVGNTGDGFALAGRSSIRGCFASRNERGIRIVDNCVVRSNTCTQNTFAGIFVEYELSGAFGVGNVIRENHVTGSPVGIDVDGFRNLVIANTAAQNTSNIQIAPGNANGPLVNVAGAGNIVNVNNGDHPWANFVF